MSTIKSYVIGQELSTQYKQTGRKNIFMSNTISSFQYSDGINEDVMLISCEIGQKIKKLDDNCFRYCRQLRYVTKGMNVKQIGDNCFDGCKELAVSGIIFENKKLISIGDCAFRNTQLTGVDFYIYGDGYTYDDYDEIRYTSKEKGPYIGKEVFKDCNQIKNLVLGNTNELGVEMFNGCTAIESITFKNNYGNNFSQECLCDCKSITQLTIPSKTKTFSTGMFKGCESLNILHIEPTEEDINNGNGFKLLDNYDVFSGCTQLTSVNFGDGMTALSNIGNYSLRGSSLTTITFPKMSVEEVQKYTQLSSINDISTYVQIDNQETKNFRFGRMYGCYKEETVETCEDCFKTCKTNELPMLVFYTKDSAIEFKGIYDNLINTQKFKQKMLESSMMCGISNLSLRGSTSNILDDILNNPSKVKNVIIRKNWFDITKYTDKGFLKLPCAVLCKYEKNNLKFVYVITFESVNEQFYEAMKRLNDITGISLQEYSDMFKNLNDQNTYPEISKYNFGNIGHDCVIEINSTQNYKWVESKHVFETV